MTRDWSAGTVIGMTIAALAVLGVLAGAVALWRMSDGTREMAVGALVVAVIIAIGTGAAMWPWTAQRHRWTPKTGTVQQMSKPLINEGQGDVQQRVAVVYTDGRVYECDDTCWTALTAADGLTLSCKREGTLFELGTDGRSCTFGQAKARNAALKRQARGPALPQVGAIP